VAGRGPFPAQHILNYINGNTGRSERVLLGIEGMRRT
jgi:hypothetical protein